MRVERRRPAPTRTAGSFASAGVTVDITDRKRAEERQNLLTREVDHRAKNALALAQSIVRLTRAKDVTSYVQAVEGRITALARVHTVLSLSSWQGAEIGDWWLRKSHLIPTPDRSCIEGAEVQLQPTTAQTLALGSARTRDQLGQVRQSFHAVGPACGDLGGAG